MKIGLARVLCAGFLLSVLVSQFGNSGQSISKAGDNTSRAAEISLASTQESTFISQSTSQSGPLKSLVGAKGLYIGAAVNVVPMRNIALYRDTLAREFNIVVPENVMKMGPLRPSPDKFDFTDADTLVDFAEANKMAVRGHTLVWHNQTPTWMAGKTYTRQELLDIMHEHISTVVGRYKGRIVAWDVVNEAIGDDAKMRKSIWLDTIGPDFLDYAFKWAHEADPQAKLFYNDYGGEGLGAKSTAIFELVKGLKARGVPIDGVGLQMHVGIGQPPNATLVTKNIKRLNDLGLQVQITEMDVKIQDGIGETEARLKAQAKVYGDMLDVCLKAVQCTAFVTWGFTDQFTWIPGFTHKPDSPLLFDKKYQPKPAYNAMVDVLTEHSR